MRRALLTIHPLRGRANELVELVRPFLWRQSPSPAFVHANHDLAVLADKLDPEILSVVFNKGELVAGV